MPIWVKEWHMATLPRRHQLNMAFASNCTFKRLQLLNKGGRSQVDVNEEALEQMPLHMTDDPARTVREIRELLAGLQK
jgi:hypothetical protein